MCGAGGWRQKDCREDGLSQEGSKVTWPHHSGNRQGTQLVLPACFSSHVESVTVTPSFLGSPITAGLCQALLCLAHSRPTSRTSPGRGKQELGPSDWWEGMGEQGRGVHTG